MEVKDMINHPKKTITIKDVALRAGVSVATASRVISGRGYASHKTKERVYKAAAELRYKPHAPARSLKSNKTKTVGLMIADIANYYYAQLASGVLDCAKKLGYHVILCATDEDPVMEQSYLQVLMESRADGIIAIPTGNNHKLWKEAVDLGTQLVLVDREISSISDVDVVLVDNVKGSFDATSYLISLGHERIGLLNGPISTTTGKGRLKGYYNAYEEAKLPIDQNLIEIIDYKGGSGFQATKNLLSLENPPTAIFATNNVFGEASLIAIREKGLKIPNDISLIIFDDVPWATLTTPSISVVSQPTYEIGWTALERLVQRLQKTENSMRSPIKAVLRPELIIRESCKSPHL
jgi:LacI family transcriptional regulator